jgi:hypothetical protein
MDQYHKSVPATVARFATGTRKSAVHRSKAGSTNQKKASKNKGDFALFLPRRFRRVWLMKS